MRRILLRSIGLALLGLATPATVAAQATEVAPSNAASAAPVKEKKICRAVEATGSRLGGPRVCHTSTEWAEIDNKDSETTGIKVRRGAGATPQ